MRIRVQFVALLALGICFAVVLVVLPKGDPTELFAALAMSASFLRAAFIGRML